MDNAAYNIADAPLLDLESALKAVGRKQHLLDIITKVYLRDMPGDLEKLDCCLQHDSNLETFQTIAHAIKGNSAQVGAARVKKLATVLEEAAALADKERCTRLYSTLLEAYEQTEALLQLEQE